jgi:hypothetical protein
MLVAGLGLLLRYLHKRENQKLELAEQTALGNGGEKGMAEEGVERPRERPVSGFRYIY